MGNVNFWTQKEDRTVIQLLLHLQFFKMSKKIISYKNSTSKITHKN